LKFLAANIYRNEIFDDGVSRWKPPHFLQRPPTITLTPSPTPSSPCPDAGRSKEAIALMATICAFLVGSAYALGRTPSQNIPPSSRPTGNRNGSQRSTQSDGRTSFAQSNISRTNLTRWSCSLATPPAIKASVRKSASQS
jgi:hypothetical protein